MEQIGQTNLDYRNSIQELTNKIKNKEIYTDDDQIHTNNK